MQAFVVLFRTNLLGSELLQIDTFKNIEITQEIKTIFFQMAFYFEQLQESLGVSAVFKVICSFSSLTARSAPAG